MKIKKHEILNKKSEFFSQSDWEKNLQPLNGIVIHANHFSVFFFFQGQSQGFQDYPFFQEGGS